jgi:hypothetical protein
MCYITKSTKKKPFLKILNLTPIPSKKIKLTLYLQINDVRKLKKNSDDKI